MTKDQEEIFAILGNSENQFISARTIWESFGQAGSQRDTGKVKIAYYTKGKSSIKNYIMDTNEYNEIVQDIRTLRDL